VALADRVRPRIGDVVEIVTDRGLAYAQYTHKHARYGAVLRVFGMFYSQRPSDFVSVVQECPQFTTCFPLGAACSRGIVKVVANEVVASPSTFPVFRTGVADLAGKTECWWLWDGEHEHRIGALKPGMEKLPIRGIMNDTMLIERLLSGWRAENVT
jgi:hypothetical protein